MVNTSVSHYLLQNHVVGFHLYPTINVHVSLESIREGVEENYIKRCFFHYVTKNKFVTEKIPREHKCWPKYIVEDHISRTPTQSKAKIKFTAAFIVNLYEPFEQLEHKIENPSRRVENKYIPLALLRAFSGRWKYTGMA